MYDQRDFFLWPLKFHINNEFNQEIFLSTKFIFSNIWVEAEEKKNLLTEVFKVCVLFKD